MMNLLLLCIGLLLPAASGWLALRLCEGRYPVLHHIERLLWAVILGPTLWMLVVRMVAWAGWISLTFNGFFVTWLILTAVLAAIAWRLGLLTEQHGPAVPLAPTHHPSKKQWIVLGILLAWTVVKLGAGAFDLVSVPTYWDDSFNNWNMRAKVFFLTGDITPNLQGETLQLSSTGGISSYPPTVALIKTWLVTFKGTWDDSLVNSVHFVWFLLLIGAFFFTLRRFTGLFVSLLGVYLLVSMPLVLLHGTNPYADIFVAMHLLVTVACLLQAARCDDYLTLRRWLLLFAFCAALLTFTKNEGTALYLPLCIIAALWVVWRTFAQRILSLRQIIMLLWPAVVLFVCVAGPWFAYKMINNLSFGNGKYLSSLNISFHADALNAILFQLMQEANFLLLPLVLLLTCIMGWRKILALPYSILALVGIIAAGAQIGIFIFTGLATEAVLQTGLARGMVQVAPLLLMLVILVWDNLWKDVRTSDE
ncbi:MAG: hypothetical protein KBD00_00075 [Candidatus Peribacteraceae bacterium]|nr:hypothetical protein [Candidatus Peribacteraceae bacterium]